MPNTWIRDGATPLESPWVSEFILMWTNQNRERNSRETKARHLIGATLFELKNRKKLKDKTPPLLFFKCVELLQFFFKILDGLEIFVTREGLAVVH